MVAPEVIEKKVCNAFFRDAQLKGMGYVTGGDLGSLLLGIWTGGAWVGGNVYLTPTTFGFELNRLNKVFASEKEYRVEIPLVEIREIIVKPSWGIAGILLTYPQGAFKIRVRGAKEFAALIEATKAKAEKH